MSRSVAVMQPYLYPYPGYFRLLAASDTFVIFDDVQFMRRGRVHRCETAAGQWLTLPLRHQPRETLIGQLEFAENARASFDQRLARHGIPRTAADADAAAVCTHLYGPLGSVVDFLDAGLRLMARILHLDVEIIRSSSLRIDAERGGEARIIAIVSALGGTRYVNAPGGRALYDAAAFAQRGLELRFLPPYAGRHPFLLPAILHGGAAGVRAEMQDVALES